MRIATLVLFLLGVHAALAADLAGVTLENKTYVGSSAVVLNGAGVRTRLFVKVYVGALYLPEKASDARQIIASSGAKRVSMSLLRDLSAQQLIDALEEGLRANLEEGQFAGLKGRRDLLAATMREIGAAKKGTVITLDFVPRSGTRITVGDAQKGEYIQGEDFYAALLRIWLGEKPVDESLKKAMLGQAR